MNERAQITHASRIFYRRLSEVLLLLEHFACTTFFGVVVPLVAKVRLGRHACNGGMASARSVKFTPTVGCLPSIGAFTCARGEGRKLPQTIVLFNIWTVGSSLTTHTLPVATERRF